MADLAQVLLLPAPTLPQRFAAGLPAREGSELAVNADPQGGDTARAKRFRFRVYDGSESGAANNDAARRAGAQAALAGRAGATASDGAESATGSRTGTRYAYNRNSGSGASSAFLAQSIAQEQLGEGLHNPPNAAASAAYSRTGAALNPRISAGVDIRA
jgi:hypothetical protein